MSMPFRNVGSSQILSQLESLYKQEPLKAERRFRDLSTHSSNENREFLEERFRVLRVEQPFLDFMLVDDQGRIQGYWSSFQDLLKNKTLPTPEEQVQTILKSGRFHFLFNAPRNHLLFYLKAEEKGVRDVHKEFSDQQQHGQLADGRPIYRLWVYPAKDQQLVPKGYVVGRLTFWDIREEAERRLGFVTPTTQTQLTIRHSAYVGKHPSDGKKLSITPRRRSTVLLKGGLTVDDKYGSHRLEADHSYEDFVSGALAAYTGKDAGALSMYPMVLLYKSRPKAELIHSQN